MRNYFPHSKNYRLERQRYYELKAFCRQYRQWKQEIANCYGLTGVKFNGVPVKGISDPTAKAAERALALQDKVDMVEEACKEADELIWRAILLNVTEGVSYEIMGARGVQPYVSKSVFYEARMRFFWILDKKRQ